MTFRLAALVLLLVAPAAPAQQYSDSPDRNATHRAALLQGLERGKQLKGSHEQYQHLPQVFAVERASSAETPEQAIARTGDSGAQVIETKGRLVLYRASSAGAALVRRSGRTTVYPTAVNAQTGTLGVLTGTLVVKPKNMGDADAIGARYALETTTVYPQIQAVFYRAKAGADIADASAALQADARVESAYPEIVEH